jgi:hypothetical protein
VKVFFILSHDGSRRKKKAKMVVIVKVNVDGGVGVFSHFQSRYSIWEKFTFGYAIIEKHETINVS